MYLGAPGWLGLLSDWLNFSSGHHLKGRGIKPCVRLSAKHGACLRFSLSLFPSLQLLHGDDNFFFANPQKS